MYIPEQRTDFFLTEKFQCTAGSDEEPAYPRSPQALKFKDLVRNYITELLSKLELILSNSALSTKFT